MVETLCFHCRGHGFDPNNDFLKNNFTYFSLAVLHLCCCMGFSLVVARGGLLFVAVHGLLVGVASLVAEQGL